jgi:hypothetical protein
MNFASPEMRKVPTSSKSLITRILSLLSNQVIIPAVIKVLEMEPGGEEKTNVKVKDYRNNKAWPKGNWAK